MKAPDKIYLPNGKEAVQNGLYKTWFDTDEHDMPYAEYIRKEALLEWINKKLQESADRLDYMTNKAYAEIFDKLNEM